MGRHARIMCLMLLVMLLALTGCEKTYTGSDTDTMNTSDTETQTETVQETEKETNPATVRESVESEKVTEGSVQNKKVYESSLGYSVIYDESLFEYNRTGDYDEIGLKGQTFSSKPAVFFAAMKIKNEDVPDIMKQIFTDSAQETTIGTKAYHAVCQPTTESLDNGKGLKYHNQYLVNLANGDALLFEVQWYEEVKSDDGTVDENTENESKKLSDMLDSIEIEVPVKGASVDESVEGLESEAEQTEEPVTEVVE